MITKKLYNLDKLKPLIENDKFALYGLGYITETTRKGVRVNKQTNEQVEVIISTIPKIHVITILQNNIRQR